MRRGGAARKKPSFGISSSLRVLSRMYLVNRRGLSDTDLGELGQVVGLDFGLNFLGPPTISEGRPPFSRAALSKRSVPTS